ncbi:MAG: MBL fold metallo-hydrolase [Candidatus Hinthialibacter sp.]
MVEWRVYGCGSPSSSRSTQTSYEIVDGHTHLHIDLGHGALYRRCLREGSIERAVNSIQNLLITHSHPDHCFDLSRLYVSWMFTPQFTPQKRVSLYATEETLSSLQRMMENTRLEGQFDSVYEIHPIQYEKPVTIGEFSVIPQRNCHIDGSCGVFIQTPSGKRIVFTSDTGYGEDLIAAWKDADLLVLECSFVDLETPYHLHLGQAVKIAEAIQPECLMLVHFYPDMERKPEEEIRSLLSNRFSGQTFLGRDGLSLRWDSDQRTWIDAMMF